MYILNRNLIGKYMQLIRGMEKLFKIIAYMAKTGNPSPWSSPGLLVPQNMCATQGSNGAIAHVIVVQAQASFTPLGVTICAIDANW